MAQYDVIFEGKTLPGKDIKSVKRSLMSALKTDTKNIERIFSGKPVFIRKNVDADTAKKFERIFESAGALCTLKPVTSPVSVHSVKSADGGSMILTNIEFVPGKTIIEHFGLVSGSTIRAKHVGKDIMAGLKNIVGGELKGYTELMQESRQQAVDRMIEQARQMGANAIINVRFSTSSVAQGAAELYAYGTAVRVE